MKKKKITLKQKLSSDKAEKNMPVFKNSKSKTNVQKMNCGGKMK